MNLKVSISTTCSISDHVLHFKRIFFVKNHDVYLVGTVITRSQALRFLPVDTRNKWYSYMCFQTACELLFGKTTCYVTMTKDFGVREVMRKTKNKDLFLIKVRESLMYED